MSSTAYDLYKGQDSRLAEDGLLQLGRIDRSVRVPALFFLSLSILWLIVGSTFGVISAIKLHHPDFLGALEPFTFGITRTMHLNIVAFGWVTNCIYAVSIWLMHRLSRVELEHAWVPVLGGVLWNCALLVGQLGIMTGHMTSVEWLEMPKEVAPVMASGFLMVSLWNVVAFMRRKSDHVYVSQWYILGAVVWFPILYVSAQAIILWFPARGAVQGITNWWFGHNVIGLFMTATGVASMYYFIPKVLGKAIHSYYLSVVGFWSFALFYNWAGVHHLIGGPIPAWMQSAGIVASVMMVIPVVVTAINFHMTTNTPGSWRIVWASPTLRFVIFGAFNYTLSSLGGSFMALREVSSTTHFTNAVIAHSHHGFYAFLTMVLFGAVYFIVPRLLHREWPSAFLIRVHFWAAALGVIVYVVTMTIHGVMQGVSANNGEPWIEIAKAAANWNGARSLGGILMTSAHIAFAINFFWMLSGAYAARAKKGPTLFSTGSAA